MSHLNLVEPELGLLRYITQLPAGLGRQLAFDGAGRELGNGWFDLSARIAVARPGQWRPLQFAPKFQRPRNTDALPDELLNDLWPTGDGIEGSLIRATGSLAELVPHYWLLAAKAWRLLTVVTLPAPRADDSGPPGTVAEHFLMTDDE